MMKKISALLLAAALLVSTVADAATVKRRSSSVTYTAETEVGKIAISFSKCMENQLMTFASVSINGKMVNQTSSDNIGPFVVNGWFMGGNHLGYDQSGPKTGKTISYTVTLDGEEPEVNKNVEGDVLVVDVANEIYYADGKKFCDELIKYTVSGNTIDVLATHNYTHPTPLTVSLYYGAQSMFVATELLLAGEKKNANKWISLPGKSAIDIYKKDFPKFSTYVEGCANGYQAVYKMEEGLGDASCVADNGEVYLFRNYGGATGKSYHVMMWNNPVKQGDTTTWHAIYSWFDKPTKDTFRTGDADPMLEYPAYFDGRAYTMHLDATGTMTYEESTGVEDVIAEESPVASVSNGSITILADAGKCFDVAGKLIASGKGTFDVPAGVYVVSDDKGYSGKFFVK